MCFGFPVVDLFIKSVLFHYVSWLHFRLHFLFLAFCDSKAKTLVTQVTREVPRNWTQLRPLLGLESLWYSGYIGAPNIPSILIAFHAAGTLRFSKRRCPLLYDRTRAYKHASTPTLL